MAVEEAFELIRECAVRRDSRLWTDFLNRFQCRLLAGVRRGLRRVGARPRPWDLEDLVQEVYCKLLEREARHLRRCRGREERAIGAYLGKIAESVAIDHVRALRAAKRGRDRVVRLRERGLDRRPAERSPGPEERILWRERRRYFLEQCRQAVGPRSPKRDLRVLYLAYIEGWSSREIARRVGGGLTPSSVDSVVHRARKRLAARGLGVPERRALLGPAPRLT